MRFISALLRARKFEVATGLAVTTLIFLACQPLRGYEQPARISGIQWLTAPLAAAINSPNGTVVLAATAFAIGLICALMVAWVRSERAGQALRR